MWYTHCFKNLKYLGLMQVPCEEDNSQIGKLDIKRQGHRNVHFSTLMTFLSTLFPSDSNGKATFFSVTWWGTTATYKGLSLCRLLIRGHYLLFILLLHWPEVMVPLLIHLQELQRKAQLFWRAQPQFVVNVEDLKTEMCWHFLFQG